MGKTILSISRAKVEIGFDCRDIDPVVATNNLSTHVHIEITYVQHVN
jgi:hypothetical protein